MGEVPLSAFLPHLLPRLAKLAVHGGVLAGVHGVIHDQITFTISPEYFTRMKFIQFAWADAGFPPRVFAGQIGFISSWWVGLFSAWFLARIAVPARALDQARRQTLTGFGIVWASAILGALMGAWLGRLPGAVDENWTALAEFLGIADTAGFVQVGYIHHGSYLGGAAGLGIAIFRMLRLKKRGHTEVYSGAGLS